MQKLKSFLLNPLTITVVALLVLGVLGIVAINNYLHNHTHHGQSLSVPNFVGMQKAEVAQVCENKNLRYTIHDTDYNANLPLSTIIHQQPKADAKVKEERKIYLTINESSVPLKPLAENLERFKSYFSSYPEDVKIALENRGFRVDSHIVYEPDITTQVLALYHNDQQLDSSSKIPEGALVTIHAGNGNDTVPSKVPSFKGKQFSRVKYLLKLSNIKLGNPLKKNPFDDPAPIDEWIIIGQNLKPGEERKPTDVYIFTIAPPSYAEIINSEIPPD